MNEISINLVSTETLDNLESEQKVRYIIDEVKNGKVLVLERGLYPIEEAKLIETTMMEIDHETFIGIEMQSYNKEDVKKGNWLKKLLSRKSKPRMSVIGPADLLTGIRKDGKGIQAMILTREFIVRDKVKEQTINKNQKHLEYWFGGKNKNVIENGIDLNAQNEITNQEIQENSEIKQENKIKENDFGFTEDKNNIENVNKNEKEGNVLKIKENSEIEKEKTNASKTKESSENLGQEIQEKEIEKQMSKFSLLKRFANFGRKKDKKEIKENLGIEENSEDKIPIEENETEKKENFEIKEESENREIKTKRGFFSKFRKEKEEEEIKSEEVAEENSEIKEKKGFFSKFRKEKVDDMN